MKHFRLSHLIIIALTALTACTANDIEELVATPTEGAYTYNLHLDMPNPDADATATRAAGVWADGSRVEFYFYTSVGTRVYTGIPGTATYSAKDDSWTLTTTQPLPSSPTNTDCEARYVKPGSDPTNEYFNAVYFATSTYTLHDNDVYTDLTLKPCNGRLRFRGTAGTQFTLTATNLRHCAGDSLHAISYSAPAGFITKTTIPLTVGSDGYTAYIYGLLTATSTFTLTTGYLEYTHTVGSLDVEAGKSIVLDVPIAGDTKGWTLTTTTSSLTPIFVNFTSEDSYWAVSNYNESTDTIVVLSTNWREFEEYILCHPDLPRVTGYEEFDAIYEPECNKLNNLYQWEATQDHYDEWTFIPCIGNPNAGNNAPINVGAISYTQDTGTRYFEWKVDRQEMSNLALNGIKKVSRAVQFRSRRADYPDMFIIFHSGNIEP